jgi:NAD(P)-dependent dehydrogenase (short-subunit alcohol dehydrogenase family)
VVPTVAGPPVAGRAAEAAPTGPALLEPEELLARLVAIVSARTGYPEDMLGQDLDVEADLSIDSIKRLEILGELADAIGLTDDGSLDQLEDLVEELAARKTLRGIVDFLFEHADRLGGEAGAATPAPAAATGPAGGSSNGNGETRGGAGQRGGTNGAAHAGAAGDPGGRANGGASAHPATATGAAAVGGPGAVGGARRGGDIPAAANRFVVGLHEVPLADAAPPADLTVGVSGGGRVAAALVDELTARGVTATAADAAGGGSTGTGLLVVADLLAGTAAGPAGSEPLDAPGLYARLRPALLDSDGDVVVVTPLGGGLGIDPPAPRGDGAVVPIGAGARGLVKTAALEFPDRSIRLVDVDATAPVADIARAVADEVAGVRESAAPVEVGWRGGVRRAPHPVDRHAPVAAGPAPPLTAKSVVLLTGGARGITAEVALTLARAHRCRLELVGRSALPVEDEAPTIAACPDTPGLRTALVQAGWREPRAIEAECQRLLAAREVRATLAALADAGSEVTYHQLDVRDADALAATVAGVYERHGRLDGLVHGAGMLDDHFIADKTPDAFARVFATKVGAAGTLLGSIRAATADGGWAPPAFVVLFGSIAGVCGNRGQADYAAANDALDAIAAANQGVAARVVALDWGPWSPAAGMVSSSLARLFEECGMGLIDLSDGTSVVLDELGAGAGAHQVVVARCSPELMAASLGHGRHDATVGAVPGAS